MAREVVALGEAVTPDSIQTGGVYRMARPPHLRRVVQVVRPERGWPPAFLFWVPDGQPDRVKRACSVEWFARVAVGRKS